MESTSTYSMREGEKVMFTSVKQQIRRETLATVLDYYDKSIRNLSEAARDEKYNKMSAAERKKIVDDTDKEIADLEETFKSEVKKLQANYEKLMADKDATIKAVQTKELGLLKSIKN